ncbi:VanZ family protein [Metabacillus lacus]|nr:VanZ family protein [Metabacillus lacus]
MKLNKWYSLLVSFIYFIYIYNTHIFEGASLLEYLNVLANFGAILLISSWLISKSVIENTLDFIILCGFILYLFILHSYVTYVDISYYFNQDYVGNPFVNIERINLIPFKTIYNDLLIVVAPVTVIQTIGNIILLAPLAFALLSLKILTNKNKVIFTIILTTLFIEIFQFIQNFSVSGYLYSEGGHRAIDIDDILLNTLGGLIGVLVFILYNKTISNNTVNKKDVASN